LLEGGIGPVALGGFPEQTEYRRTAAAHQGHACSQVQQVLLQRVQDGVGLDRDRLEYIGRRVLHGGKIALLHRRKQFAVIGMDRGGIFVVALEGPGGGDAEIGLDQNQGNAGESFQRGEDLTDTRAQDRSAGEAKGYIGADRGCQVQQLLLGQGLAA